MAEAVLTTVDATEDLCEQAVGRYLVPVPGTRTFNGPVGRSITSETTTMIDESRLFYADREWDPSKGNPFAQDGAYGPGWSAFIFSDRVDSYTNRSPGAGVYSLTVNPLSQNALDRLIDFVTYEQRYGRTVIIQAADNVLVKAALLRGMAEPRINPYGLKWVVHSTTTDTWQRIRQDGCLCSPNVLRRKGISIMEIGLHALLEPADYSDFVMLDILDGCGELVVNSRQLGYVCTDVNMLYVPGVRLYFDAAGIIGDGIGVSDGLHVLKVHHELPLGRYLAMPVDQTCFEPSRWTPKTFTRKADEYFLLRMITNSTQQPLSPTVDNGCVRRRTRRA